MKLNEKWKLDNLRILTHDSNIYIARARSIQFAEHIITLHNHWLDQQEDNAHRQQIQDRALQTVLAHNEALEASHEQHEHDIMMSPASSWDGWVPALSIVDDDGGPVCTILPNADITLAGSASWEDVARILIKGVIRSQRRQAVPEVHNEQR